MPKKTFDFASEEKILLVQLKDNQKHLLQDVQVLAENTKPSGSYMAKTQYGHGRIANRTTQVYHQGIEDYIIDEQWAAQLKTLACVKRTYDVFNTKTKCHDQRNETAWYVCNAKLTAEQAADFILNHWGIENVNHYVRDVALCEDDSRIRNNSGNMAILRSAALNILRKQKVENIKGELYQNSLCWKQLYTYSHLV